MVVALESVFRDLERNSNIIPNQFISVSPLYPPITFENLKACDKDEVILDTTQKHHDQVRSNSRASEQKVQNFRSVI